MSATEEEEERWARYDVDASLCALDLDHQAALAVMDDAARIANTNLDNVAHFSKLAAAVPHTAAKWVRILCPILRRTLDAWQQNQIDTTRAEIERRYVEAQDAIRHREWRIVEESYPSYAYTRLRILLLGRTGAGKSTLANCIVWDEVDGAPREIFKTSATASSCTFDDQTHRVLVPKLRAVLEVTDTVGIGDTKLSEEEVLYKLAEAAAECKDGIDLILWAVSGRLSKEEVDAWRLMRETVFDQLAPKRTTIVRTAFQRYQNAELREQDRRDLQRSYAAQHASDETNMVDDAAGIIWCDNVAVEVEASLPLREYALSRQRDTRDAIYGRLEAVKFSPRYLPGPLAQINSSIAQHVQASKEKIAELHRLREEKVALQAAREKAEKDLEDAKRERLKGRARLEEQMLELSRAAREAQEKCNEAAAQEAALQNQVKQARMQAARQSQGVTGVLRDATDLVNAGTALSVAVKACRLM